jgi:cobyrinic acid a,c-diamide synthase
MGCMNFDPDIRICGVVLNRVAGKRHEGKVRTNIEKFCNVPVFGAIPKLNSEDFPERHMGLVTSEEHAFSFQAVESAAALAEASIDLDALYQALTSDDSTGEDRDWKNCGHDSAPGSPIWPFPAGNSRPDPVTIGIVRDSAFQFYYPDNIEALKKMGADIVFISPLNQSLIPEVHAIYMGGGFPETHAAQLAKNRSFRENLKQLSQNGMPIYAECGGLIFLGTSIRLDGQEFPMSGILPIKFGLSNRPQGHGYTQVAVVHENPFYKAGEILKGHEFRYSSILDIEYQDHEMAFKMERGKGILDKKDGFFKQNTFGTYTHIHALGSPSWAPSLVKRAKIFKAGLSA